LSDHSDKNETGLDGVNEEAHFEPKGHFVSPIDSILKFDGGTCKSIFFLWSNYRFTCNSSDPATRFIGFVERVDVEEHCKHRGHSDCADSLASSLCLACFFSLAHRHFLEGLILSNHGWHF